MEGLTWKTPHETPHIASPNANTDKDGAKTGIKIIMAIQTIKTIMVGRQPNLSWVYELTKSPASWPTRAELLRPDCQGAGMSF